MKTIKEITAQQTYPVRLKVLRKGIDLPFQFEGDLDVNTFHLGAFKEKELVGVATFMKRNNPLLKNHGQYQLRGMATLKKVRGLGFGKTLLQEGFYILKQQNTAMLWCNAREAALKFYQKNGFKIVGTPFVIPLIGIHYVLKKEL